MSKLSTGNKISIVGIIVTVVIGTIGFYKQNGETGGRSITNIYVSVFNKEKEKQNSSLKELEGYKEIKNKVDFFKKYTNDVLAINYEKNHISSYIDYYYCYGTKDYLYVYYSMHGDEKWEKDIVIGIGFSKKNNKPEYFRIDLKIDDKTKNVDDTEYKLICFVNASAIYGLLEANKENAKSVSDALINKNEYKSDNYTYFKGVYDEGIFDNTYALIALADI